MVFIRNWLTLTNYPCPYWQRIFPISFRYYRRSFHWIDFWIALRMSYQNQLYHTFCGRPSQPSVFDRISVAHLFSFMHCVFLSMSSFCILFPINGHVFQDCPFLIDIRVSLAIINSVWIQGQWYRRQIMSVLCLHDALS